MIAEDPLSRRSLLVAGAAAASGVGLARPAGAAPAPVLRNPLVLQRADAQVFRHVDGTYYLTGSVPEYDRLIIRRARTGLSDADGVSLTAVGTGGYLRRAGGAVRVGPVPTNADRAAATRLVS